MNSEPSNLIDLNRHLGASGEEKYLDLIHMLEGTEGMSAFFPVESDFPADLSYALLERLRSDLEAKDETLYIARLTGNDWDLIKHLEKHMPESRPTLIAVIGLEDTPKIMCEAGAEDQRPPALAVLNHERELLHRRFEVPMILWCSPLVHYALQRHAPDLFDHYTALFSFLDATPAPPLERNEEAGIPTSREPTTQPERAPSSPAAVSFYEEQLHKFTEPSEARSRALLGLADSLWALHDIHLDARLDRAEEATRESLAHLTPADFPHDWARGQVILGNILGDRPTGNRQSNLEQAIEAYKSAFSVYTKSEFPSEWATTQNNLGEAYRTLPVGDRESNLRKAIACYEAALEVTTREAFPSDWAMTQNNLGNAYAELPGEDRESNLRKAIACYEAALEVHTREAFPSDWATTQNNLGNAYCDLPGGDRESNLRKAIACYEAALNVRTREAFPSDWAHTQNNLGAACYNLPGGDRESNLRKAIACYQAPLEVWTQEAFPHYWEIADRNLQQAQVLLAELSAPDISASETHGSSDSSAARESNHEATE
jgi:tetratricopeptide (TPR) repeat protein